MMKRALSRSAPDPIQRELENLYRRLEVVEKVIRSLEEYNRKPAQVLGLVK